MQEVAPAPAPPVCPPPAPARPKEKTQLPALTGLRFVLALWVIVHHLTGPNMLLDPWMHSLPQVLQNIVHGGYLAVGTFFVLSGFVLGLSYIDTEWSPRAFLRYANARIARVYPVYLLSVLVLLPIIAAELADPQKTGTEFGLKAGLIGNYVLVLQGWFGTLPVHWNTPAWSLSCELFFYASFPVLALLLRRAGKTRLALLAVFAVLLPNVLGLVGVRGHLKPIYHVGDFLMGIIAALAYKRIRNVPSLGPWLYVTAGIAGLVIVSVPSIVPHGMTLNSALRPFNATLLVGLALGSGIIAQLLSTRLMTFLGKASYAMYILHIPILWWFKRYFSGVWTLNVTALIYIALVIVISGFVCLKVEEPANRWIRALVENRRERRPGSHRLHDRQADRLAAA